MSQNWTPAGGWSAIFTHIVHDHFQSLVCTVKSCHHQNDCPCTTAHTSNHGCSAAALTSWARTRIKSKFVLVLAAEISHKYTHTHVHTLTHHYPTSIAGNICHISRKQKKGWNFGACFEWLKNSVTWWTNVKIKNRRQGVQNKVLT